jgi:hypothetical protein
MIPIYTIQSPLHHSVHQMHTPQLTHSQQQRVVLLEMYGNNQIQQQPYYNTYQMQQADQNNASVNTVLYYPPGTSEIRLSPSNSRPASSQLSPMKYPYYPEISPEEPAFMPAPLPSMFLSDRNLYCEQTLSPVYRSREPTQPAAPQLKSIYLQNLAADACCSTGVALATLALSVILFVVFVVVAIQLGRSDIFCDGYVGPILFVPALQSAD